MTSPRRGGLATRVLATLAIATVAPTVLVGALAIRRAQSNLEHEVVRGNLALIRAMGASLDSTLESARRSLELAAAWWADERTADTTDDAQSRAKTARLLRRLRREVPLLSSLSIVDVRGRVLSGDPVAVSSDLGAHTFGGYVGDVVFEDGVPRVRIIVQARSRTGELAGVFVAKVDLRFIADALSSARLGRGARLLVVDGRGALVAASDPSATVGAGLRRRDPAVARALGSAAEGSLQQGGVVSVYRNLTGFQSLRGIRWAILLEQPARYAYALARNTARDTIVAGALVLALALAIGVLLARRLTRPLRDLAVRADAIAATGAVPDDAPPAPVDAPGEIGALAHRLDEMARRIGERDELQDAVARGDRLATVGTLAASVAHEINNPLTTVLGYANFLAEDKPDDHPDRAPLALIADEAARMKTIVGNLLDYARAERAPRSGDPADVNALLERTVALVAPSLRKTRVDVALELARVLPRAAADAHTLQQVFVNLVQNAAQATPDGGTVTLASRLAPDKLAVEVTVADDGPGVQPELREHIFEPFYTTKEAGTGTGLGLAVCRHLVTACGGTIAVEEAPGERGALFRVVIPIEE